MKSLVAGRFVNLSARQGHAHLARTACGGGRFTTLGVAAGRPLFLAQHLGRLRREAKGEGEVCPSAQALRAMLERTLQVNRLRSGVVRLGWTHSGSVEPFVLCEPTRSVPRRAVVQLVHRDAAPPGRHAKSEHQLRWASLRHQARLSGVFDLLVIRNGWFTETSRFNVFLEIEGCLCTPPEAEVFCGVAREVLLADADVITCVKPLALSDLALASRVLLTNSVRGQVYATQVVDPKGRIVWPLGGTAGAAL